MVGMECKLCSKKFCNGRALGGHMRSHYATLPLPPKTPQRQELSEPLTESTTSSILSCDDERESSGERSFLAASYGLRENPRKAFRLADPEFLDAVVDRESDSESTRARCSKRAKGMLSVAGDQELAKKGMLRNPNIPKELEMEEDVALGLIMLSRDVWRSAAELGASQMGEKVYKCERCEKSFKSSQGLGSHRANHHKKIKISFEERSVGGGKERVDEHECILCGKIFRSAQALGGHKRSHFLPSKFGKSLVEEAAIDLNLPAETDRQEYVVRW